jgi:hypothetical protein
MKYEYKVVLNVNLERWEKLMNQLAKEGWEYIDHIQNSTNTLYCSLIFRRERAE